MREDMMSNGQVPLKTSDGDRIGKEATRCKDARPKLNLHKSQTHSAGMQQPT